MTRKATTFSLLLAVLLTIGAVAAGSAQAEPDFEALEVVESEGLEEEVPVHANVKATEVEGEAAKFSIGIVSISCPVATGTATLESGSSTTLPLAPSFSECKASSLYPAEVNVGSCKYSVHSLEETEAELYKGKADIACGEGGEMLITVRNEGGTKTKCIIHVPTQAGLSSVKAQDMTEAEPDDVTLTSELAGITAVVTKGEETCPIPPATYTNAKYTGRTTVTAANLAETPPINYDVVGTKKFHFTFEKEEMRLVGTPDSSQRFGFPVGVTSCLSVLLEQTIKSKNTVTLEFQGGEAYEECELNKAFAEVKTNGCEYKFRAKAIEFQSFVGRTFIVCPPNTTMEVKDFECTVRIPEQMGPRGEGLGQIVFTNVGTGKSRHITADLNIKDIAYEEEGEGCVTAGKRNDGTFGGRWVFKGYLPKTSTEMEFFIHKTP